MNDNNNKNTVCQNKDYLLIVLPMGFFLWVQKRKKSSFPGSCSVLLHSPASWWPLAATLLLITFQEIKRGVGLLLLRSCCKKLENRQREPFSHPQFSSPFSPGTKRRGLLNSGSGQMLGEFGKSFLFSESPFPNEYNKEVE